MQHTKEPSTNTRIWVKTRKKFKIVAALTDSSIVEVMERLAEQEFKRIQYKKVQYKG